MEPDERPSWAFAEVVDGATVLLDERGRRVTGIAVTADELGVLRAALRDAPQGEAGRALPATLHEG